MRKATTTFHARLSENSGTYAWVGVHAEDRLPAGRPRQPGRRRQAIDGGIQDQDVPTETTRVIVDCDYRRARRRDDNARGADRDCI